MQMYRQNVRVPAAGQSCTHTYMMNVTSGQASKLSYGVAAVDADDLAGHVGRRRHAEKCHHGRHLLRLADPPHGQPRHLLLHQLRVYRLLLINPK